MPTSYLIIDEHVLVWYPPALRPQHPDPQEVVVRVELSLVTGRLQDVSDHCLIRHDGHYHALKQDRCGQYW